MSNFSILKEDAPNGSDLGTTGGCRRVRVVEGWPNDEWLVVMIIMIRGSDSDGCCGS